MSTLHSHPVVQELAEGNDRFLSGVSLKTAKNSLERLEDLTRNGQKPKAVVLCCSDSRCPVEMVFDQDIGDLFVIRVAGNIIAPSLVGSVEYAIANLGTEVVVVMGHSYCGAVTATLDNITNPQEISSENIHDIVSRIKPHIFSIAQIKELPRAEMLSMAVEANVRASVGQLSHSSRLIEGLVQTGKLTIAGSVLDLLTGKVTFIER